MKLKTFMEMYYNISIQNKCQALISSIQTTYPNLASEIRHSHNNNSAKLSCRGVKPFGVPQSRCSSEASSSPGKTVSSFTALHSCQQMATAVDFHHLNKILE
jgi:hypothetical protein